MRIDIVKTLLTLIIVVAVISQASLFLPAVNPTVSAEQPRGIDGFGNDISNRESTMNDIKLFFHRNGNMDTNTPTNQAPDNAVLRDGTGLEFSLSPSLFSDLYIIGKAQKDAKEALWLDMTVDYNDHIFGSINLTFNIFDDTTLIASTTEQMIGSATEDTFLIPFVGSKTDHTFSSNSIIKVNITASISGPATVRVPYDTQNSPHGFLYLTCNQIGTLTLGAFHNDGSSGEFAPNTPVNREISFKGEIIDTFGGYDISRVSLTCPSLSVFPTNAEATIFAENEKASYYYNWTYPYEIPPGQYTVLAAIYDNNDNSFDDSTTFTIASYDVYIHIVEPEKSSEKGKSVVFDLEVTNIGGASDTFTLVASPSVSWSTQFNTNAITLDANTTGDITLTVSIPGNADDNQQNIITITATSQKLPSKQMSVQAIATAMATTGFTFELLSSAQQDIEDGETATYNFKLVNIGQNTEMYIVEIADNPSPGWQVTLEGGTPASPGTSYIRLEASLASGSQANFVLKVKASGPSTKTQVVEVAAQPKNDTGMAKEHSTTTKLISQGEIELSITSLSEQTSEVEDAASGLPSYKPLTYSINIRNTGLEVTVSFDVTLPSSASNWDVIKPNGITLDEGSNEDVSFTVTPSSNARVNEDGYTISFRATPQDSSGTPVKTSVVAKVKQFHKIEASIEDDKTAGGGGATVDYKITVKNHGNGQDTISIILSENEWEHSWSALPSSSENLDNTVKFALEPEGTATVVLTFTTPSDVRNGDDDSALIIVRSEKFNTDDDLTYMRFPTTTKVEKGTSAALMDALSDLLILIILVVAVIIIAGYIKIKLKERGRS